MARKKLYRLNPGTRIDKYVEKDFTITTEPTELTAKQADKVLGLEVNGRPLVLEVAQESDEEAPDEGVEDSEEA